MNPLGLHELRAKRIVRMSGRPTAIITPVNIFTYFVYDIFGCCVEDYLKGDWVKPSDLYGISKYGSDSYRIFCLGEWKEGWQIFK